MPGRTALVIQMAEAAGAAVASLRDEGWRVEVVAVDVDAATATMSGPMDVLRSTDIDAVYAAANAWQKAMPAVRLADGEALVDLRPWPEAPPVVWSWLNRLYPYVHVQVRLIELVHAAVNRFPPAAWAVVGDDPAFPWRRDLAERSLRVFCPQARELAPEPPPLGAVPPPEPEPEPRSEPRSPAPRRVHATLAAARWLLRRFRPAPAKPADPALQLPEHLIGGPSDCVLVMRGRRGSQWHFCSQRGVWGLRDEYIENVPEALIEACRAAGRHLTIVYHGDHPETDGERRGYSELYPDVVREIATGPVSNFFRAHRRAVAKKIPPGFHDRYLKDPAFAKAFSHRGVEYWECLRPHAEEQIPRLILAHLTQHVAWSALFRRLSPKAVVGGRLEAVPAMTEAAHVAGARVVSVKLGVGQEMLPSLAADHPDGSYALRSFPDALAVWSPHQVEFIRAHIPAYPGRLAATGRARNDTFAADTLSRHEVRARLGIPAAARLIVYAATARTHYARWPGAGHGASCLSLRGFEAGLRALARLAGDDTWVLVKPHPADDLDAVAAFVTACGNPQVTLLRPGGPIHNADLLGATDVLVSSLSSIFAEAVPLDCPAVNLWLPEVNFLYEEERCRLYGRIAVTVASETEMVETVCQLMDDPVARAAELARAKAALSEVIGSMDGGNAARIAALVMDELALGRGSAGRQDPLDQIG